MLCAISLCILGHSFHPSAVHCRSGPQALTTCQLREREIQLMKGGCYPSSVRDWDFMQILKIWIAQGVFQGSHPTGAG